MTQEWGDIDRRIAEWLDSGGRWDECPDVKRTMLFGGGAESNWEHQGRHFDALMAMSLCGVWEEVLEVGAIMKACGWLHVQRTGAGWCVDVGGVEIVGCGGSK